MTLHFKVSKISRYIKFSETSTFTHTTRKYHNSHYTNTGPQSLPIIVEQLRKSPNEKAWPPHKKLIEEKWKYHPVNDNTSKNTYTTFGEKVPKPEKKSFAKFTDI